MDGNGSQLLSAAIISLIYKSSSMCDGYDIMCPFGGNKMVLIHDTIADGEREETAEERDETSPSGEDDNLAKPPESEQSELDLDDLADGEEVIYAETRSSASS
jgi:hypothetical protein